MPQKMFSKLQLPLSLLTSQCHHQSSASNFSRARSSTAAGTDVDTELLSYISASHTYVGDEGLAFWNSSSAFSSPATFAQDLLAAPASQAYVERVFSVCGHLTAGKRNRLWKKLANRAFLKVNNKFYGWLCLTVEHCVTLRTCTTETGTETGKSP